MRGLQIFAAGMVVVVAGCAGSPEEDSLGVLAIGLEPTGALLPDIVEEVPQHLQIVNQQKHEYLRFSSTHWNTGAGPLQIRGGGQIAPCTVDGVSYDQCTYATQEVLDASGAVVYTQPAGVALFHPAHNHWHQSSVADFRVRAGSLTGPVVARGEKVTFCLIDFDKSYLVKKASERVYFECSGDFQGISVGWGDEYHMSTEGQDLDITGVPEGVYYLTNDADPLNHWLEVNDSNNGAWVKFQLSRKGANPEITIADTSPCDAITCGNTANK